MLTDLNVVRLPLDFENQSTRGKSVIQNNKMKL